MSEKITQVVALDISPSAIALERTAAKSPIVEASLNPVLVYLSQLSSSSRRTMRGALETIAKIVSTGEFNAISFPWAELRYQHTQAIYYAVERFLRI